MVPDKELMMELIWMCMPLKNSRRGELPPLMINPSTPISLMLKECTVSTNMIIISLNPN